MIPAGGAGAAGNTSPHSPIRGPPTGESGIDISGGTAAPGLGTSEESTGGGGAICGEHAGCAAAAAVASTEIMPSAATTARATINGSKTRKWTIRTE